MTAVERGDARPRPAHDLPRPAHDLERLFHEEAPGIWRALYAFTGGSREIADDALAEAFARAIANGTPIRRPVPWLYAVSFRIAAAELRRRRTTGEPVEAPTVDAPEVSPVLEALRQLSPNQRAAIVLFYEADLPVADVARRLGVSSATARVHLHRGRNHLRELLGNEEVDPP